MSTDPPSSEESGKSARPPRVVPADFPVFSVDESGSGWERITEASLYESPYISLHSIRYRTPGRPDGGVTWTVARRKSAVIVAPRLADGRWLLIQQERLPVQRILWEFPAGQIDHAQRREERSEIAATALRELTEETGHWLNPETGKLHSLGYFFSSQGFTDEHAYLFVADPAEPINPHAVGGGAGLGEGDEHIVAVKAVTWQELENMIARNEIRDANTLCLYARLKASGWQP